MHKLADIHVREGTASVPKHLPPSRADVALAAKGALLLFPMGPIGNELFPDVMHIALLLAAAILLHANKSLRKGFSCTQICLPAAAFISLVATYPAITYRLFPLDMLIEIMRLFGLIGLCALEVRFINERERDAGELFVYTLVPARRIALAAIAALLAFLIAVSTYCGMQRSNMHFYVNLFRLLDFFGILLFALGTSRSFQDYLTNLIGFLVGLISWLLVASFSRIQVIHVAEESLTVVLAFYCLVLSLLGLWFEAHSRERRAKRFRATEPLVAALERHTSYRMLSQREREVASLLVNGRTLQEIATMLSISPSTVGTYRKRILQKMGFATKGELIAHAHQLVSDPAREKTSTNEAGSRNVTVAAIEATLVSLGVVEKDAEVLALVATGKTTKQISSDLFISPSSVSQRRQRGYRALGIHSKRELLARIGANTGNAQTSSAGKA